MTPSLPLATTKFHLSLNTNNLAKSVKFLSALLGCPPAKHRGDYAKFEPADLPLVLSLEPRSLPCDPVPGTSGKGALNHVGLRLTDAAQLVDVQRRLEGAGYPTQRLEGVECCYARQTKFWVFDDEQTMWEVYVLDEDLEHRGGEQHELDHASVAAHESTPALGRHTWTHRLNEEFPTVIPLAGELEEIALQGSWNARMHLGAWQSQLEKAYSALRPGGKLTLHMLTSQEGISDLQPLPGLAAVVQVVPLVAEVVMLLRTTGFLDIEFKKYSGTPCFLHHGVELRETRLQAIKPFHVDEASELVRVVYKGPALQIVDDSGTVFERSRIVEISGQAWQRIAASASSESFVKFIRADDMAVGCTVTHGTNGTHDTPVSL